MTVQTELENWLHEEVGPTYDAIKADPARALTPNQVRDTLADLHANHKSDRQTGISHAIEPARRVEAGLESLASVDKAEGLNSAEAIAFFLAEAEATGDPGFIADARKTAARARLMYGIK
ncbi:transcriptional regulator [Paracidovorax wautersii]|uniref:Addiction module antidote protein n=1 Tax=Paracidovorax wautersii TaxID=1177982 RepID=A0A1I2GL04_9BURK|nr:transcriptional regulator [Paracidovorax wautersii]SFF17709.1 hypothetical protein SAMN04489711_11596 [Paracidovorax wautersii]